MATLKLNAKELAAMTTVLSDMEQKNGKNYSFVPESSAFSCKCSGPAQSCVWH